MSSFVDPDCVEGQDPQMAVPLREAGESARQLAAGLRPVEMPEVFAELGPALTRLSSTVQLAASTLESQGATMGQKFRDSADAHRAGESANTAVAKGMRNEGRGSDGADQ